MSESDDLVCVPIYIPSVDKILGGGMPIGSTVLVVSEPGAGGQEMILTSLVGYCREIWSKNQAAPNTRRPGAMYYVTPKLSRSTFITLMKRQFSFLDEMNFEGEFLDKRVFHYDFGDAFFARSIVPYSWYSSKSITEYLMNMPSSDEYGGVTYLAGLVEKIPEYSMVFVDSLTTYLPYFSEPEKWKSFLALMYGLARVAKARNLIFVLLLTADVLSKSREIELGNAFDGILHLVWQKSVSAMSRQRQMYIGKFNGVLPLILVRDIAIYNVTISSDIGFEISNLRRVT
ncbi:MAG: hypothetical protein M0P20_00155 [Methanocorpusculum sp.]|jgi:KaiC/GvpD/RAD55 family RecA-like ATPase|nr:hypothetical protein [Methanocorpusculum sp.]MDD3256712.1 hypothetical protein [Methanocorpusculum sp.]MDD4133320.1 hypothetical protein [Methanocorpusculum sp.]